jgi:hypothetical protein
LQIASPNSKFLLLNGACDLFKTIGDVVADELWDRFAEINFGVLSERLDSKLLEVLRSQLGLFCFNRFHQRVVVRICLCPSALHVDGVFDVFHFLMRLFFGYLSLQIDRCDFRLTLSLNPGRDSRSFSPLLGNFLFLLRIL